MSPVQKQPLHWPGIIWVVWNFFTVFNFAFGVGIILVIASPLFERVSPEQLIPLKIIMIAMAFALAINVAWLVYFILARRKYLSPSPGISPYL